MNWFANLPTRAKLFLVFGGMLLLFAVALAQTYASLANLVETQAAARTKQNLVTALARMSVNHNQARVSVLMLVSLEDPAARQPWLAAVDQAREENTRLESEINSLYGGDPVIGAQLREYARIREAHVADRTRALEHIVAGRMAEAREIALNANNARYVAMSRIAEDLTSLATTASEGAILRARAITQHARTLLIVVGAACVAISLFGTFALGRMIADPLQTLQTAAQTVSSGDLRGTVVLTPRQDEVGVLAESFSSMLQSFRSVQAEIQEGVNVLAASASEISTATAEMSASATQTATAVSQTSTTVEEVKQTAQVSAQKAGQVADVAQKAAQSAHAGRRAVEESAEVMNKIREQMELIADTIVRLSEQSQAIGDIISSVNDLAEQSNLLAVNASIEAAKAGEHGRGFGVVAQEIRSLASQSKESTAQVRSILNDIQKATTAAVMAAEQGTKAVDTGVQQVKQTGQTIRALAESIVTAAQAATQITASSQQQLIGVDQVAGAMQSILQASRQTASGTQQAEAGARNLNELGQKLKAIAQRFTI